MRILIKLRSGEEGIIVGYSPGKKGRVLAIVVVEAKLREVKLRNLEVIGWAKVREAKNSSIVYDESGPSYEEALKYFQATGRMN
jgi:hypothetical protein